MKEIVETQYASINTAQPGPHKEATGSADRPLTLGRAPTIFLIVKKDRCVMVCFNSLQ